MNYHFEFGHTIFDYNLLMTPKRKVWNKDNFAKDIYPGAEKTNFLLVCLFQSRNCELLGAYACPDLESHVSNSCKTTLKECKSLSQNSRVIFPFQEQCMQDLVSISESTILHTTLFPGSLWVRRRETLGTSLYGTALKTVVIVVIPCYFVLIYSVFQLTETKIFVQQLG